MIKNSNRKKKVNRADMPVPYISNFNTFTNIQLEAICKIILRREHMNAILLLPKLINNLV